MRGFRALYLVCTASLCSSLGCRPNDKVVEAIGDQIIDQMMEKDLLPKLRETARPYQAMVIAQATFEASPVNPLSGIAFVTTCANFDDRLHGGVTWSEPPRPIREADRLREKKMINAMCVIPLFTPTSTAAPTGR